MHQNAMEPIAMPQNEMPLNATGQKVINKAETYQKA